MSKITKQLNDIFDDFDIGYVPPDKETEQMKYTITHERAVALYIKVLQLITDILENKLTTQPDE